MHFRQGMTEVNHTKKFIALDHNFKYMYVSNITKTCHLKYYYC